MKRILSFGVVAALGVLMGCPIYGGDDSHTRPDGDCTTNGCPDGYSCTISDGVASCVANNGVDSGPPDSGPHPYSGCFADTDCTADGGTGAKCLAGQTSGGAADIQCTSASNQCADETQCTSGNCVQGVCTPACSATNPCPTGFACDSNNECTINASPCAVPGGSCSVGGSNGICVEQHCVSTCTTSSTCGNGLECVNGGCMPVQQPVFTCTTEGQQAECANGSICLRHNCYISCAVDANACATADQFNICKSVTTSSGTYQVCGSSTTLGSDCDPTVGKNCPNSGVCIDGYCH
jgi:hypothetical protein